MWLSQQHHSGPDVGNDFVGRVYSALSPVYDAVFGPTLQPGRLAAVARMGIRPGDRVLEIGIGTGMTAPLYPEGCEVTGIDLSPEMLGRARARIRRDGLSNVTLLELDAAHLTFDDESFHHVYAPYVMSVVPDPVRVAREMWRVCRPGGTIVILNHFRSSGPLMSRLDRALSPLTLHLGFRADLDLTTFLEQASLRPTSIEKVSVPRLWSLVICRKESRST